MPNFNLPPDFDERRALFDPRSEHEDNGILRCFLCDNPLDGTDDLYCKACLADHTRKPDEKNFKPGDE